MDLTCGDLTEMSPKLMEKSSTLVQAIEEKLVDLSCLEVVFYPSVKSLKKSFCFARHCSFHQEGECIGSHINVIERRGKEHQK